MVLKLKEYQISENNKIATNANEQRRTRLIKILKYIISEFIIKVSFVRCC